MAATRKAWTATARGIMEVFLAAHKSNTARSRKADLQIFTDFMNAPSIVEAVADFLRLGQGTAHKQIQLFIIAQLNLGKAATTINRRIATFRSLTREARDQGKITWRIRMKPLPTIPYRDIAGPEREEVDSMMEYAKGQGGFKGARDLAIIRLLYGMALRVSEVAHLDRQHVHLEKEPVTVDVLAKGLYQFQSMMIFEGPIVRALDNWATKRGPHDGALFTTMSRAHDPEGRTTRRGIADMIEHISEKTTGKKWGPHSLRHAAITHYAMQENDPWKVMRYARHSDMKVTLRYIHLARETAAEGARSLMEDI